MFYAFQKGILARGERKSRYWPISNPLLNKFDKTDGFLLAQRTSTLTWYHSSLTEKTPFRFFDHLGFFGRLFVVSVGLLFQLDLVNNIISLFEPWLVEEFGSLSRQENES